MTYEAKTFRSWARLEGIPVTVVIRAFVEHDKVLAIRSVRVLNADDEPYPTINDGKATAETLDALPAPHQLRDAVNRPWNR